MFQHQILFVIYFMTGVVIEDMMLQLKTLQHYTVMVT
jgi:hypothetical protein